MYKTVLKIDGMACGMCESHINDCIRNNFKVKNIKTSHKKGESVIVTEAPLDITQLKELIGKTGYTLLSADVSEK